MSTQSISPIENQNPFTTEGTEERREQPKSATEATEKHRQEEDQESPTPTSSRGLASLLPVGVLLV